jgi:hypothetical protein
MSMEQAVGRVAGEDLPTSHNLDSNECGAGGGTSGRRGLAHITKPGLEPGQPGW